MSELDRSLQILLFMVLTVSAEILGTIGGFGSSLFAVSFLQLFFDFSSVLVLTGLLHVFSNTSKIMMFWKDIDWKLTVWLGVSSVVMALVGARMTTLVNFHYTKLVLGFFLVALSILFLVKPKLSLTANPGNSIAGGVLSGFLAGFVGTGGAIRGLVLASFNLEKSLLVGTSAAIDFGVDLTRTAIYFQNGFFKHEMWIYIPVMLVASFIGTYVGKKLLSKVPQELFRKILLSLVGVMGALMLFKA